ncbi:MAG TPA: hypothetical protein VHJ77_01610 [Vicinamibacterales bacterium]|jgi:hypothetical protein|nr:hypothetical protein [Vicinamibacterales bacterium]
MKRRIASAIGLLVACTWATSAAAQAPAEAGHDVTDLAKKTQNPVGDLISVPFQFNFNTGGDLEDRTFFNLNFQPVIPFKVTENWHAIARTILPINSVPGAEGQRFSGLGDLQQQLFFTPARPGAIIWGVGPVFSLPTATATPVETGTWAAGAGGVILKMTGPWVLGALLSQFWPLHDEGGAPETDLFVLQPFINYNFGKGYALSFSPVMNANWDAPDGQQWTVPVGIGITRTTVFNRRPMNIGVQYYYNVERPDGSAGHQLRFVIAPLYPK